MGGDGSALPFDLDDRTHGVRLLATYDLPGHLSLGVIYGYDSGAPLLDYWNPVSRAWDAYRRRQGIDTAPAQNPDQRGPGSERLNLQARWRLRPLLRADLDLYVDAINLRGGAFVDASDSAGFAPGARVRAPRWYRLGAEYRY